MGKSSKSKWIGGGLIIAGIIFLFITGFPTHIFELWKKGSQTTAIEVPEAENIAEGKPENKYPPASFDLQLINSSGENVDFGDFKGKVIFMNMWATWCAPCVEEMPGINNLYNKTKKDNKIQVVMISHDHNFETAKKFVEKNNYDFEIYKVNGRFPRMYNAGSLPATYIINAEGELVVTHLGMANYDTAEFRVFLGELKSN